MVDYKKIVETTRSAFNSGKTRDVAFREAQLLQLQRMCRENAEEMKEAVYKDLRRSPDETALLEIFGIEDDVKEKIANFRQWVKPNKPSKLLANILDDVKILNDPYGVVLIIGAWNVPFLVCLVPLAGAIAAGNCCIIKPSEMALNAELLMASLVTKYLDNDCYKVILGGSEETTQLLLERFDYIFFTGSPRVGKIINTAAAKYLTPVTLELGGKNPVYVHESADIEKSAQRIMWGKCVNAGQICVGADYIICSKETEEKLVPACKRALERFYGSNPKTSKDFCRIINGRNFDRVVKLMGAGVIAAGGGYDASELYIEPTIITDLHPDDPVMQEEIFGPILPFINMPDYETAIEFVNSREKALAVYVFAKNKKVIDAFLDRTSSGGVTVNDIVMHFTVSNIPFGGVGNSGMGAYHGKYTFDMFTHKKSTLVKNFGSIGHWLLHLRNPPFSSKQIKWLTMLLASRVLPDFGKLLSYGFTFVLGIIAAVTYDNRKKWF